MTHNYMYVHLPDTSAKSAVYNVSASIKGRHIYVCAFSHIPCSIWNV